MADPTQVDPTQQQTPAQQQPPAPQPSAPSGAGGLLGSLAGFLNHPVTQAAAAAYFGALSGPHHESMTARIGQGGLEGLQTYQRAQLLKAQLPLLQAKIGQTLSTTAANNARAAELPSLTAYNQARTQQLVGDPQDNAKNAQDLLNMSEGGTPEQQAVAKTLHDSVASGRMKMVDAVKLYDQGNVDQARIASANAEAEAAKARTQLVPYEKAKDVAQTGEAGAAAQRDVAEAQNVGALKPGRQKIYNIANPTQTKVVQVSGPDWSPPEGWAIPGDAAPKVADLNAKLNTDLNTFSGRNPVHLYTNTDDWVRDAANYAVQQGADPAKAQAAASALARQAPATPPIPPNSKPVHDATGKLIGFTHD
jgi:hypothetical protein